MIEAIELALGLLLVVWILNDVFQSVVVPRPTPGIRPTTILTRLTWPRWRAIGLARAGEGRERFLGQYASLLLMTMLVVWIFGLMVGYGLVLAALHSELRPEPADVLSAVYFGVVGIVSPLVRLFSGDPLNPRMTRADSAWTPKDRTNRTLEEARRLF